jgi:DNA transposition AAA+ family ATPase
MKHSEKTEIQFRLRNYISSFSSQRKAAESLENCSEAIIIQIIKGEWDKINDGMWRNIASQLGGITDLNKLVETQNFMTLLLYFVTAKEEGASFALVGDSGWGKSFAAKWYAVANRKANVFYLECAEYWNKRMFLMKLMAQMGRNGYGLTTAELMETIVREMRRMEKPVVLMDEIDKLPDAVLKFFITFYNELNKTCGFVWVSTDAIKKRIRKGMDKNTSGFQELFSRIGATYISLNKPSADEIKEICIVNGITDPEAITIACNEVKELNGDLRRVDRILLKSKVKKNFRNLKSAA